MLVDTITLQNNLKPESLYAVKHEGVVIDFNRSQAFLFGGNNMGRFVRNTIPLCACGCGERIKKSQNYKGWNKFILGHSIRLRKPDNHHFLGKTHSPEVRKIISEKLTGKIIPQIVRDKISESLKGEKCYWYGKFHSKEVKRKISKSRLGGPGAKHTIESKRKLYVAQTGRKHSPERRKQNSLCHIGIKLSEEHKRKIGLAGIGRKHSEETKLQLSISHLGNKNPNWQGGIAAEPYCDVWLDKEYKQSIRNRDNNECQGLNCWKKSIRLCIHHINYIKKDCNPWNLISLCTSCNFKANTKRKYWTAFYQNIMTEKYKYEYSDIEKAT